MDKRVSYNQHNSIYCFVLLSYWVVQRWYCYIVLLWKIEIIRNAAIQYDISNIIYILSISECQKLHNVAKLQSPDLIRYASIISNLLSSQEKLFSPPPLMFYECYMNDAQEVFLVNSHYLTVDRQVVAETPSSEMYNYYNNSHQMYAECL